jgi:hypothetical protein
MSRVDTRFGIGAALTALSAVLLVVTLFWPDWIEALFGVEPDGGDGSVEWLIVGILVMLTVFFAARTRAEWRRRVVQRAPLH